MERVLLWLVVVVFASIGARRKNRWGAGWFFVGLPLGPFGLLVCRMPKATVPDIEGNAAREGYGRKKRDGLDMSMLSSGPDGTK